MSPAVPAPLTYDSALRQRISENLAQHERRVVDTEGRRHAAVAVVLVDSEAGEGRIDPDPATPGEPLSADAHELEGRMVDVSGGAAFLLSRRSGRLRAHSGQWALPGGRIDEGEDAITAAIRETDEELGVRLDPEDVIGLLDDYPTRSGYVITPVVLWGGGPLELRPSPDEVLAAYRVGLHQLLRSDSPRFLDIPESDRPVVQIPLGDTDRVHAPTGAVLLQLRRLGLEGDSTRVDDLEQPTFAWR
ncbi:CoA pyrophosphatase [Aeromicrobium sp.]|uniref:NUDIX hydrolase n=1 Tax=Aeromicrobium sp. TaxID=1871063 RepID=UPI0028A64288|nr:CoA pyrophosphatase [Aeromicrobium sp.]